MGDAQVVVTGRPSQIQYRHELVDVDESLVVRFERIIYASCLGDGEKGENLVR